MLVDLAFGFEHGVQVAGDPPPAEGQGDRGAADEEQPALDPFRGQPRTEFGQQGADLSGVEQWTVVAAHTASRSAGSIMMPRTCIGIGE